MVDFVKQQILGVERLLKGHCALFNLGLYDHLLLCDDALSLYAVADIELLLAFRDFWQGLCRRGRLCSDPRRNRAAPQTSDTITAFGATYYRGVSFDPRITRRLARG